MARQRKIETKVADIGGKSVKTTTISNPKIAAVVGGHQPLAYDAGSTQGRGRDLIKYNIGGNSGILRFGNTLIARSRDAYRQNPQAFGAINATVNEILGSGIRSLPATSDKGFNKELRLILEEEVFPNLDADGVTDWYGCQRRFKTSQLVGGDVPVVDVWDYSDGYEVGYRIRGLESEYLPYTDNRMLPNGSRVVMGVEFNATRRMQALHLLKNHPHDQAMTDIRAAGDIVPVRVSKDHCMLLYWPTRLGDVRGESALTRSILTFYGTALFRDMVMANKNAVGKIGGVLTRPPGQQRSVFNDVNAEQEDDGIVIEESESIGEIIFEPGTILETDDGATFKEVILPSAGDDMKDFVWMQDSMAALSLGILSHRVGNNSERYKNDRVYKADLASERRGFEATIWTQDVPQLIRPVYRKSVGAVLLSGLIKPPRGMDAKEIFRAIHVPQSWEYLHPVQEEQARKLRLEMGLTNRTRETAREGEDAEEIDEQRAVELERERKLGLHWERAGDPTQGLERHEDGSPTNRGMIMDDGEDEYDAHRSAKRYRERGLKR